MTSRSANEAFGCQKLHEEDRDCSVILDVSTNDIISSFCNDEEFIYMGTICKEWTRPNNTTTSNSSILISESRLREAIDSGFILRMYKTS